MNENICQRENGTTKESTCINVVEELKSLLSVGLTGGSIPPSVRKGKVGIK